MNNDRPIVLSVAGFDPSGGAGLLADIKVFELNKTYGLGVCTANTFQNDVEFAGLNWIKKDDILFQIKTLSKRFDFGYVKIGLIESADILEEVVAELKKINSQIKIIWDPIIKASAGYVFHESISLDFIQKIAKQLYLITPNIEEMKFFLPDYTAEEGALLLSEYCNVLLKGGHGDSEFAEDLLMQKGRSIEFKSQMFPLQKRGTGCVLSSAIVSALAKGKELEEACKEAKDYINKYILSHHSLMGYHHV